MDQSGAEERDLNWEGCPLHAPGSGHAVPVDTSVPLSRFDYVKLLVAGYAAIKVPVPQELALEWGALLFEESQRELERLEEARKVAEALKNDPKQKALEEYWVSQRQLGRTKAAEKWFKEHGIEPWEITEIAEEDWRQQENLAKARQQQGLRKPKKRK